MTFRQLKYVIAIADSGSVNSAAKNHFISQPSLYVELALFWLGKDT